LSKFDSIVLGAGCFWCVEAVFSRIEGVVLVSPGYSGGDLADPTYREVCSGLTTHVEVVKVEYDPQRIDLMELFAVFFATHDPTTVNRQGNDVGAHYRSVIFYNSDEQLKAATIGLNLAQSSGEFSSEIVTAIEPAKGFYLAEDYHHNYYSMNSEAPYCSAVIMPKIEKLKKKFRDILKD
jgi:peptide-methionine (S)-S-oxide reductase